MCIRDRACGVDKNRCNECLELVGLSEAKNKKVKDYSLGMKQRLGLATALLANPDILILDEPINGLDPEGIRSVSYTHLDVYKRQSDRRNDRRIFQGNDELVNKVWKHEFGCLWQDDLAHGLAIRDPKASAGFHLSNRYLSLIHISFDQCTIRSLSTHLLQ